jgi:hypothetical protein
MHCHSPFFSARGWAITLDRGYSEIFQYVKMFWIVLIFFILAIKKRRYFYLSWSLLFGYLLLDDSFLIHEKLGSKINSYFHFGSSFGLRAQDFGELSVSILFGSVLIISIVISYYYANKDEKKLAKYIMIMLIVLCFFGIFIDMIGVIIQNYIDNNMLITFFDILEDGGEMIVMSIIAWYIFSLNSMNINKISSH